MYVRVCAFVLKSYRSKMRVLICSQKYKQCALPVVSSPPTASW